MTTNIRLCGDFPLWIQQDVLPVPENDWGGWGFTVGIAVKGLTHLITWVATAASDLGTSQYRGKLAQTISFCHKQLSLCVYVSLTIVDNWVAVGGEMADRTLQGSKQ